MMPTHKRDAYLEGREERERAHWRRYAEHNDGYLARLLRKAYGWERHANPRKNRRATKRYADRRQKKG